MHERKSGCFGVVFASLQMVTSLTCALEIKKILYIFPVIPDYQMNEIYSHSIVAKWHVYLSI